jgi:isopenicillin N synthase-like dioxygenase
MVDKSPNLPVSVQENVELFDRFISLSQYLLKTLLSCLSDALNIDDAHRLEHSHRDGQPTNTTLVLLRYPKNADAHHIGHNKHTDIGSLTLLFSNQWGLQVVTPEKKEWAFVQPRANHAIINVGDSLRFLSGKRLNSCLHRVIPVNGACQEEHRYSIAYFLRPESEVKFEDADGQKVSAEKWHDDKYVMFAEPHEKQEMSKMLTGGMEQILVN